MHTVRRILVVEDEPTALGAIAALLRWEGHAIETAADGKQALVKMPAFRPDLVLTDLRMPGLDGLGLMRKIHEQDPALPVIIMSAYAGTAAGCEAEAAGAACYLGKPLDFGRLVLEIERALVNPTHRPESAAPAGLPG